MDRAMNKTRVDDLLMEMITPKITEIEEKFSRGDGLNQEDINTLLLKSQYNHINHLDSKLDEVTADVASLKGEFTGLEGKFTGLEGKFVGLEGKFTGLEGKFVGLEGKFDLLQANLRADMSDFKKDIQETINNTMKWYIGGAGVILVLLKSLDLFIN
jgi:predicted nuclease with TOPRIM domain